MSRHVATSLTAALVTTILLTSTAIGSASAPGQQPPVNVTPPTISGAAVVGNTLTASTGTWSGKALRYAYQWLHCDSTGASCAGIAGATGPSYSLSSAAAGATLRVVATASNKNGSAAATSAATAAVASAPSPALEPSPPPSSSPAPTPPSVTSAPTISGTTQQGLTLSASTGTWSGTTPMSYAYQWQRCDSSGNSCAPVSGATGATFLLALADVASTMRVSVTASNSAGSATASSAATAVVTVAACTEPTNAMTDRLYSCASAFNKPIPANPPIHPDSAGMMSWDVWVKGYDSNTTFRPWLGLWKYYDSLVYAPIGTPFVTVQINNPTIGGCNARRILVPIPSGTQVANNATDRENALGVLYGDGREFELFAITPPGSPPKTLYGLNCAANSYWQATSYAFPPGWNELGYRGDSIRGSDIDYATMVKPQDVEGDPSDWGHALAIRSWRTCASGQIHPRFVSPTSTGDGRFADPNCIPMGARVQLDPSVDCATWPSLNHLNSWARSMCRTFQRYGAIIVDTGAVIDNQVYNTNWSAYPWASEYCITSDCSIAMPNDLMARFRVIDWTKWTGA